MQLIDEENDSAVGLLDLIQDGLQPLLKFTPVFGAGNQRAHIQREDRLVLQALGYILLHNPLRQTLGNGSFTNARLADQHRVILRLAGQNPNDISNFLIPADDRVLFLLSGSFNQICAIFFKCVIGSLRIIGGHTLVAPHCLQRLQAVLPADIVGVKQICNRVLRRLKQAEEQVLHGDELVLHGLCLILCSRKGCVHIGGDIEFIRLPGTCHAGNLVQFLLCSGLQTLHGNPHLAQQLGNQPPILLQKGKQQVNLLKLLMIIGSCNILRGLNRFQ